MSSIGEILKKYSQNINSLDTELILENVIKKPRSFILAHPEYKLNKFQISNFKFQISRRMRGEPLAYILGEKEFYGLKFKINKHTLIPCPETEMMVDEALKIIEHRTWNMEQKTILIDVGTGSGCIIITLAKLLGDLRLKIKDLRFFATDISEKALQIARQNAKLHKVDKKIKFLRGNLIEPIIKNIKNSKFEIRNSKFIILANLPYLTPSQIKNSPSIKYDPRLALSAGRDGLKYYRRLFKQIKNFVKFSPNSQIFVIIEIDPSQSAKLEKIIKTNFPKEKVHPVKSSRKIAGGISQNAKSFNRVKIKKDLSGLNRMVAAQIR